jgi:hypothetical protein
VAVGPPAWCHRSAVVGRQRWSCNVWPGTHKLKGLCHEMHIFLKSHNNIK